MVNLSEGTSEIKKRKTQTSAMSRRGSSRPLSGGGDGSAGPADESVFGSSPSGRGKSANSKGKAYIYIYIRFRFVWSRSVVVPVGLQRSTWSVWLLLLHSSWVWVFSLVLWCCRPPACVVCIGYTQTAAIPPHLSSPFLTAKVYLLESLKKNNVIKMCFSSIVHPPASSSCIDHLLNAFRVLSMAQSPSSVGGVAVDVPVWDIYFREEKKTPTPILIVSFITLRVYDGFLWPWCLCHVRLNKAACSACAVCVCVCAVAPPEGRVCADHFTKKIFFPYPPNR